MALRFGDRDAGRTSAAVAAPASGPVRSFRPMPQPSLPAELWAFMRARKKLWLLPLVLVLLAVGAVVTVAQGSALAPFLYALF